MPEVLFTLQLPDGEIKSCYSPSSIVRDYFKPGQEITAAEFLKSSREAFSKASERVRMKYGFACSAAAAQLDEIEEWGGKLAPESIIRILKI